MSLTKLPLGRNNSVMTSLFPPRESLVVTSRLGTGNSQTFFLRCRKRPLPLCVYSVAKTTTNRAQQTEQGHSVHTGGYFQPTRTKLRVFFLFITKICLYLYFFYCISSPKWYQVTVLTISNTAYFPVELCTKRISSGMIQENRFTCEKNKQAVYN